MKGMGVAAIPARKGSALFPSSGVPEGPLRSLGLSCKAFAGLPFMERGAAFRLLRDAGLFSSFVPPASAHGFFLARMDAAFAWPPASRSVFPRIARELRPCLRRHAAGGARPASRTREPGIPFAPCPSKGPCRAFPAAAAPPCSGGGLFLSLFYAFVNLLLTQYSTFVYIVLTANGQSLSPLPNQPRCRKMPGKASRLPHGPRPSTGPRSTQAAQGRRGRPGHTAQ